MKNYKKHLNFSEHFAKAIDNRSGNRYNIV